MDDNSTDIVENSVTNAPAGVEPDAILASGEAADTSDGNRPTVTFRGNSYDLMSVITVTIAGVLLFVCGTCNVGFYCLPFIPVILGVVSLLSLKDAVDPERTRLLSWIGISIGTVFSLIILAIIAIYVLYVVFLFTIIASQGSGGF